MYHALLALLQEYGYEAKAQECAINAAEYLIETKRVNLGIEYIYLIRSADKSSEKKDAKSLREELQYGTETKVNEVVLQEMKNNAIKFVEAIEVVLYGNDNDDEETGR